jgi:hypothetical protein
MENACSLRGAEIDEQRRRHEALGRSAAAVEREASAVHVRFDGTLDRGLLDEMIRVERRCCPFFRIDYDEGERRLSVAVDDPHMAPALEILAERLGEHGAREAAGPRARPN